MHVCVGESGEWKCKFEAAERKNKALAEELKITVIKLAEALKDDEDDDAKIKYLKSEVTRFQHKYNEEHIRAEAYEKKVDAQ